MGLILAILMICAVTSTAATRAEGEAAVKPFARIAGIIVAVVWLAIALLPRF